MRSNLQPLIYQKGEMLMFEMLSAMKVVLPLFLVVAVIAVIVGVVKNMIDDFLSTKFGAAVTLLGLFVVVYLANQGVF